MEATLALLEEMSMKKRHILLKTVALVAAVLVAATAVAAVIGRTLFKDTLYNSGVGEVAALVQEPHAASDGAGIHFAIDELIWEGSDLYFTYTLSVPDDSKYLVALFTPTLNGKPMTFSAKGWLMPKFFDQENNPVLLLGNDRQNVCTELLTFSVDPVLRTWKHNALAFRAVVMKTHTDFKGQRDFTPRLNPPEYVNLSDGSPMNLDALAASGLVEIISERQISLDLDSSLFPDVRFNDVQKHDFDLNGVHIHIDDFSLSHTSASVAYTVSCPETDPDAAQKKLNQFLEATESMAFGTIDGQPLGYTLEESGGAGFERLPEGTPVWHVRFSLSAMIPLEKVEQIILAPVTYPEDDFGNQLSPIYDMDLAVALTPVHSDEAPSAQPKRTPTPEKDPLC